jgi:hypothetical protein
MEGLVCENVGEEEAQETAGEVVGGKTEAWGVEEVSVEVLELGDLSWSRPGARGGCFSVELRTRTSLERWQYGAQNPTVYGKAGLASRQEQQYGKPHVEYSPGMLPAQLRRLQ